VNAVVAGVTEAAAFVFPGSSGSFQWGAITLTTGSIIMPMSTAV